VLYFGYILARVVTAILPMAVSYWIAERVADLWFAFSPKVRANLRHNLGLVPRTPKGEGELGRISHRIMRNFARVVTEFLYLPKTNLENIGKLVDVGSFTRLKQLLGEDPAILVTAHVGNWELLGAYFSLMGYPVNVLATRLRDSRLNDQLVSLRDTVGLKVIERSRGLKQAFRCLRRGEVLGVLIDQDTSVDSVIVDFLGQPAKTAVGPVKLAARTGASIIPLAMLLMDDGSYHIKVREPLHIGGHSDALKCDVEECSKAIEGFIYEKPSQWVWMHRRWKSVRSDIYR